jgi:hypothetical protein
MPPRKTIAAMSCKVLGERCRAASEAHDTAGRALDVALRRNEGPTTAEWKAEHDARVDLRVARAAYVRESQEYTAMGALVWHVIDRGR